MKKLVAFCLVIAFLLCSIPLSASAAHTTSCIECGGSGRIQDDCSTCGGTGNGTKLILKKMPDGSYSYVYVCAVCNGSGLSEKVKVCPLCLGEKTIYAYYVVYNANGGSNAPQFQTKYHRKDLIITGDVPVRSGYTFVGWAKTRNGPAVYFPWSTYSDNADITLYAVWKAEGSNQEIGDVNSDGKVNATDATLVLQFAAGIIGADKVSVECADVDGDGKVNASDATYILQYSAGIIKTFGPSFGSTFTFNGFKFTIGTSYTFKKVDSSFQQYKDAEVVEIPVTYSNIGDTADFLFIGYDVFGSAGTQQMNSVGILFQNDIMNVMEQLPPNSQKKAYFHVLYDGEGDYCIKLISARTKEEVEILLPIKK